MPKGDVQWKCTELSDTNYSSHGSLQLQGLGSLKKNS